jgi:hypothetical protein
MAKIGTVTLKLDTKGAETTVDVSYQITFDKEDEDAKQVYEEMCRLIGDDTNVGDPKEAGPDDTLGFLTPMFTQDTAAKDKPKLERHFTKTFRTADLDEDRAGISNPDEFRARVTLTPLPRGSAPPIERESALVKRKIG